MLICHCTYNTSNHVKRGSQKYQGKNFHLHIPFFPHVLHVYSHSKMFSEKFFLFYKHGIYLQFILQYTKNAILIWPYFQQLLLHKSNHVLRLNAWFYHIFCKKISQTIEPEPLKSHF